MPACANCSKPITDREKQASLQCSACKGQIHLGCTELQTEDRVTRQAVRGLKILCNGCSANIEMFSNLKALLEDHKIELHARIDQINVKSEEISQKLESIEKKLVNFDDVSSPVYTDKIANEAVDRINRAKNVFIRGVPEAAGDVQAKKSSDKMAVDLVLRTVESDAQPITFFRVGKPNQRFPRMNKLVMPGEHDAKQILRNKGKLLENSGTRNLTVIDDKTPVQLECLKILRTELDTRKRNGESNLTIRYVQGVPKIVNFR